MPTPQQSSKPQAPLGPRPWRSLARRRARDARDEDGQALIEFALVLPIVLLLLLGIAYFGIALNDWIDETQIASEGARFAAVNENCIVAGSPKTCEGREEAAFLKYLTAQGDNSEVNEAKATMCSPTSKVGDYVEVKLTYKYKWIPIFEIAGAESPVTSTAQMKIEAEPSSPYPTTC
jgi:hypothetical protein